MGRSIIVAILFLLISTFAAAARFEKTQGETFVSVEDKATLDQLQDQPSEDYFPVIQAYYDNLELVLKNAIKAGDTAVIGYMIHQCNTPPLSQKFQVFSKGRVLDGNFVLCLSEAWNFIKAEYPDVDEDRYREMLNEIESSSSLAAALNQLRNDCQKKAKTKTAKTECNANKKHAGIHGKNGEGWLFATFENSMAQLQQQERGAQGAANGVDEETAARMGNIGLVARNGIKESTGNLPSNSISMDRRPDQARRDGSEQRLQRPPCVNTPAYDYYHCYEQGEDPSKFQFDVNKSVLGNWQASSDFLQKDLGLFYINQLIDQMLESMKLRAFGAQNQEQIDAIQSDWHELEDALYCVDEMDVSGKNLQFLDVMKNWSIKGKVAAESSQKFRQAQIQTGKAIGAIGAEASIVYAKIQSLEQALAPDWILVDNQCDPLLFKNWGPKVAKWWSEYGNAKEKDSAKDSSKDKCSKMAMQLQESRSEYRALLDNFPWLALRDETGQPLHNRFKGEVNWNDRAALEELSKYTNTPMMDPTDKNSEFSLQFLGKYSDAIKGQHKQILKKFAGFCGRRKNNPVKSLVGLGTDYHDDLRKLGISVLYNDKLTDKYFKQPGASKKAWIFCEEYDVQRSADVAKEIALYTTMASSLTLGPLVSGPGLLGLATVDGVTGYLFANKSIDERNKVADRYALAGDLDGLESYESQQKAMQELYPGLNGDDATILLDTLGAFVGIVGVSKGSRMVKGLEKFGKFNPELADVLESASHHVLNGRKWEDLTRVERELLMLEVGQQLGPKYNLRNRAAKLARHQKPVTIESLAADIVQINDEAIELVVDASTKAVHKPSRAVEKALKTLPEPPNLELLFLVDDPKKMSFAKIDLEIRKLRAKLADRYPYVNLPVYAEGEDVLRDLMALDEFDKYLLNLDKSARSMGKKAGLKANDLDVFAREVRSRTTRARARALNLLDQLGDKVEGCSLSEVGN